MITGCIADWERDRRFYPEAFSRALDYFFASGGGLPIGSHEIEGRALYVNVEYGPTKPVSERRFEVHGRYVDIQLLLEGSERQDFATRQPSGAPDEDRMEAADIAFHPDPENIQTVVLEPGRYAVYFPGELHAPNLAVGAPENHLKAVFKIRADLVPGA